MKQKPTQSTKDKLKKKLIWKGTVGEGIKLGKFTQEEVDEWNEEDNNEREFNKGYNLGKSEAKKHISDKCIDCYEAGKQEAIQEVLKLIDTEIVWIEEAIIEADTPPKVDRRNVESWKYEAYQLRNKIAKLQQEKTK